MNKAIFWDLQGTLGGDAVGSITEFIPYPFTIPALRLAKAHGWMNIIITNQSRIGKGLLAPDDYRAAEERILGLFNAREALIDQMLCCPHTARDGCDCKKPRPGLILRCVREYDLDLPACWVIGDMGKNEIIMARNAGCHGALVLTGAGQGSLGNFRSTWSGFEADLIAGNALEAIRFITGSAPSA